MYFYDTDFNLINTTEFAGVSNIKDVCYINQTNDFVLACESSTGSKLVRGTYNGDIQRENSDQIVSGMIDSGYASRIFYNAGSKSTFNSFNTETWNVDLYTLVADLGSITAGQTSVMRLSSNTETGTMEGLRGVNLNDTIGAALSGHDKIIFKDFKEDTTFIALSSATKIWDINAFDEKLYVQTDNKLKVFDADRNLLSTHSLTTSATSGYKIDFISEDYKVKPIVLSRGSDYNLIVDKIDDVTTTYALGISSADLGYDFSSKPGVFVSPTNMYSLNQTYKEYENKFCILSKFDNSFSVDSTISIWDTTTAPWTGEDAGNWSINYSGVAGEIDDNSVIEVIEGVRDGHNCLSIDADLLSGRINVHVNGKLAKTVNVITGIKPLKNYLNSSFYIGAPNYALGVITDYVKNQQLLAKNGGMGSLYVYDNTISDDMTGFHYLNCSHIDPVTFDILSGTRNSVETISTLYSYTIPGSLSNRIKVYIKNGNLQEADANKIIDILTQKIGAYVPLNITNIDYDFSIGNQISSVISRDTLSL